MITRLVIHRFRGIREGTLDDIGKINVIVGPNNSGKTAILETLYLGGLSGVSCDLIQESLDPSVRPVTILQESDMLGLNPLGRIRMRHGYAQPDPGVSHETIDGEFYVKLKHIPSDHLFHEFRFVPKDKEVPRAEGVSLFSFDRREDIPPEMVPPFFEEEEVLSENSKWHYLLEKRWAYKWESRTPLDSMPIWAEEGIDPAANNILFFDFHTIDSTFTKTFVDSSFRTIVNWEHRIAKILGDVFSNLHGTDINFKLGTKDDKYIAWVEYGEKTPIEINNFGDGTQHAMKLIASLIPLSENATKTKPGMFLWEDPELFFHPRSLNRLIYEIFCIILNRPIQLFISTQSIEVVGIIVHQLERKFNEYQDELRVFRLGLDNGHLKSSRFYFENIRAWLEHELDPRYWDVPELPIEYHYHEDNNTLNGDDE